MTARQKRFIAAAYIVNNGEPFNLDVVAERLGWTTKEAQDIYSTLIRSGNFLGRFGKEQNFTPNGRELARELIENGDGEGL